MISSSSLVEMPDNILNEILAYCDFKDVLSIRKVCRSLQHFIDDVFPESTLKDLNISIHPKKVCLDYFSVHNTPYIVEYHKTFGNHCMVKCQTTIKVIENSNLLDVFLRDLEIVLMHQKSLIRLIRIVRYEDNSFEYFLENFKKLLHRPLKIEEFHMYVKDNQNEILAVLPHLDPQSIIGISLYQYGEDPKVLEIGEIVKLEHWKRSEQLHVDKCILKTNVRELANFSLVDTSLASVSAEEMMVLKEKLLYHPLLAEIYIRCTRFDDKQQFLESLGIKEVSSELYGITRRIWHFEIPNSDDVLRISYRSQNNSFAFNRVQRSEVTDHAEVLNL
ncbi:hypothetical protein CRE_19090 [Caenorhabditis remanei]|uniref:F-box domain-containing protein n=1 Tax=Caenorhabditis remanei TaxID=31234 RepID=E3LJS2_CAERE|nr:hypothetical protein CRE_19090 [Caenorhabditis remanei]